MNRDIAEGGWKQFKGTLQVWWSKMFHDSLGVISGRRMQLTGERQWAYGILRSKTLRGVMSVPCPVRPLLPRRALASDWSPSATVMAVCRHENR